MPILAAKSRPCDCTLRDTEYGSLKSRFLNTQIILHDGLAMCFFAAVAVVTFPNIFCYIFSVELPHNEIWRPDIVVYEEIGIRDYSPRLQKFKILSNGLIEYREPTVFETTCSIDTAFFPFDVQVSFSLNILTLFSFVMVLLRSIFLKVFVLKENSPSLNQQA